jgi:hypothetical protein
MTVETVNKIAMLRRKTETEYQKSVGIINQVERIQSFTLDSFLDEISPKRVYISSDATIYIFEVNGKEFTYINQ